MYIMTSHITVGTYVVKVALVKWKCSVSNLVDTCTIQLPRLVFMPNMVPGTGVEVPRKFSKLQYQPFKEGDPVTVQLGYDNDNKTVFKGFLKRINQSTPLQLECEGYNYPLYNVVFNKSYPNTTLKKVLQDLTTGTGIQLSPYIPDMQLSNLTFKNVPGMKVLEWFQKECLCSVYFDFDQLYVGASRYGIPKPRQRLLLGWNTVDDKNFKKNVPDTQINIQVVTKNPAGSVKKTKSDSQKYSATKEIKVRSGLPDSFVKQLADEIQKQQNYAGFSGNITCFLVPYFEKGYSVAIKDRRFPERRGLFFVETVEGSFDSSGGLPRCP